MRPVGLAPALAGAIAFASPTVVPASLLAACETVSGRSACRSAAAGTPAVPQRVPSPPAPYRAAPGSPLDYRGPGRDEAPPDVAEVLIGWFGPGDPDHPEFGEYYRGALLALEQENAAGGLAGKPFRLVHAWSESAWAAGIVDLTRLVYERGAWAVLGGVDGATTHLAVQVALKSRFALLSPGSTDASVDAANVPWLFSLPPSDDALAPVVGAMLERAAAGGSLAVVAATDHDSHAALVGSRRALERRGLSPEAVLEFAPGAGSLGGVAARVIELRPKALLVIAPARTAGRLVAELRASGFQGAIVGGATLALAAFRRAAGAAAEGVAAPCASEPGPEWSAFARSYERRFAESPDGAAARGYDALRLVAAAARRAGLNRARIRDEIRALAPWAGAAGTIRWDARGRNEVRVAGAVWRSGRLQ